MAETSGAVQEAGWGQWAIHFVAEWAAESRGRAQDADLNEQEEMTCIERYMKTRKQVATGKKSAIRNENIAWSRLSPRPTNQRSNLSFIRIFRQQPPGGGPSAGNIGHWLCLIVGRCTSSASH